MSVFTKRCINILKTNIRNQSHIFNTGRTFAYKSPYSVENLYPKSSMKIYTPTFVPEDPNAKFTGYIPMDQIDITYSRSSGPGGQNVNRVNTKVDIRFSVKDATWISDDIKEKLFDTYKNQINKKGYLVIKSEATRSQQLNVAHAFDKLRNMIWKLAIPETPEETPEDIEIKRKRELKAARLRVHSKRIMSRNRQRKLTCDVD